MGYAVNIAMKTGSKMRGLPSGALGVQIKFKIALKKEYYQDFLSFDT